jgi:aldehyde oxidoreductase
MATKVLLDKNPNPTVPEIKRALAANLCRCTGYKKIIEAVQLAGQFLRRENTPGKVRAKFKKGVLGVPLPRPSSMLLACGLAKFTADIKLENALEVAAVHSSHAHARIKSIDTSAAEKMPGVVGIVRAGDIKGTNIVRGVNPDQPVLCEEIVRYIGDPILAVAADTRDHARAAAAAVKVEYEPLPVIKSALESIAPGAYQIHKQWRNLCYTQHQVKGDVKKGFAESKHVIEGKFTTQIVHQAALEPEACICYFEGEGQDEKLIMYGRSIMIHGHAAQVGEATGCKVRYREPFVGGQFGIKASLSSEGIAAAVAVHFHRPVRYIPSLLESFYLTTKRTPFTQEAKLGVNEKGHIVAYSNDFIGDKGAYTGMPYVIDRCLYMFSSAYDIPNSYALGRLAYTNANPVGAARGAGPPQAALALESLMDMMAEKLGIDPLEFRKMNSLKDGGTQSTGTVVKQWTFPQVCDAIKPHYERAKKEAAEFNKKGGPIKKGVGIAAHSFGVGSRGDEGIVSVELDKDDGITIYGAVADPGEGNDAMMTQIAAHVMDMPVEKVRLYTRDMDKTVPTGPAAGSRVTYMVGGAIVRACEQLKQAMKEAKTKTCGGLVKAGKPTRYQGINKIEGPNHFDANGQGAGFDSQVHNIQMAEVEVNTATGEAKVIKLTAAIDAGVVINPQSFEGQIEGGIDQGIGYALREQYIQGKTNDWRRIKFPTTETAPDIELIIMETPRVNGPLGATGIGELTMTSTAPSVTNAIYNACGARIYSLPATPDKIKAALAGK